MRIFNEYFFNDHREINLDLKPTFEVPTKIHFFKKIFFKAFLMGIFLINIFSMTIREISLGFEQKFFKNNFFQGPTSWNFSRIFFQGPPKEENF